MAPVLERLAERAAKGAEGYPPYNIEHLPPDAFRITLAVADMFDNELREMELDHAAIELAGHAAFGSAALTSEARHRYQANISSGRSAHASTEASAVGSTFSHRPVTASR